MAASLASSLQDMTEESIVHGNIYTSLRVCPKNVGFFVAFETKDKGDAETYKAYLERKCGAAFSNTEWKRICGQAGKVLEESSISNEVDMTALNGVFYSLLLVRDQIDLNWGSTRVSRAQHDVELKSVYVQTDTVPGLLRTDDISDAAKADRIFAGEKKHKPPSAKEKSRANLFASASVAIERTNVSKREVKDVAVEVRDASKLLEKVQDTKNLRNEVMHNFNSTKNPKMMSQLRDILIDFISYAGLFYFLTETEIQSLKNSLLSEMDKISITKSDPCYKYARFIVRGRVTAKNLWQAQLSTEVLLFENGIVNRAEVYHSLQFKEMHGEEKRFVSLSNVLKTPEEVVIVSGVAGAGKTTLLKNTILQFFNSQLDASSIFSCFHLLVYIDCQDKSKKFSEVIEQQFKDVCDEIGSQLILDALRDLNILFLVDGFDEIYSTSPELVQDLLKKFRPFKGRVVITTRPHEVKTLKHLMLKNDITSAEYMIEPITHLKSQLNFLSRYEKSLCPTAVDGEMKKSFANLSFQLRTMFTEPLNLMLFCHVFLHLPDRIAKWKSFSDVASDIFSLYKILMEQKLCDAVHINLDLVIERSLFAVGKLAFEYLRSGTLIFTEADHVHYQKELLNELQRYNVNKFNCEVILSVILKMKRPSTENRLVTYSFHHKALQERFAAKYLVDIIKNNPTGLKKILRSADNEYLSILRVLIYMVQDLSESSPHRLRSSWPMLWAAMLDAGADFWLCRDLVPCLQNVPVAIRGVAEAMRKQESEWTMRCGADVDAVALMLQHAQPRVLKVWKHACIDQLKGTKWSEVIERRNGDLMLSFSMDNRVACDDFLPSLHKSRCRLQHFSGYIAEQSTVDILASVSSAATNLRIGLLAPLQLHPLRGKYKNLQVITQPFATDEAAVKVPLPSEPCPLLEVTSPYRRSWKSVERTMLALAPAGKRYSGLGVVSSSSVDESQLAASLPRLVVALWRRGVRTESSGSTRWEMKKNSITLHITQEPPAYIRQQRYRNQGPELHPVQNVRRR